MQIKLKSVNLNNPNKRLYVYEQYKITNDSDWVGWKVFDGDKRINTDGYCFKAAKNFLNKYIDQKTKGSN